MISTSWALEVITPNMWLISPCLRSLFFPTFFHFFSNFHKKAFQKKHKTTIHNSFHTTQTNKNTFADVQCVFLRSPPKKPTQDSNPTPQKSTQSQNSRGKHKKLFQSFWGPKNHHTAVGKIIMAGQPTPPGHVPPPEIAGFNFRPYKGKPMGFHKP